MNLKKISIGTASFGRLYGILDKKIIKNDAKLILQFAMNKKIDHIDTAMSYGESENIIGRVVDFDLQTENQVEERPS